MSNALSRRGLHFAIEGNGPPVVLLMGIGGRMEFAAPVVRGLRDAHRVLAFEYPGIGRSTAAPPDDLAGYVDSVCDLMSECEFDAAHMVAISFGVPLAISIAAAAPGGARSLALISGVAHADTRFRRVARVLADAARAQEPAAFARLASVLLFPPGFDEGRAALLDAVERAITPAPREMPAIERQAEIAMSVDVREALAVLAARRSPNAGANAAREAIPAKIWVGDTDAFVSVTSAKALRAAIPSSALEIVAGAGHSLFAERPREMFASVRAFLADAERGRAGEGETAKG
ncbi:MAG: alpha/beta fold hydrolase [bacterium]